MTKHRDPLWADMVEIKLSAEDRRAINLAFDPLCRTGNAYYRNAVMDRADRVLSRVLTDFDSLSPSSVQWDNRHGGGAA